MLPLDTDLSPEPLPPKPPPGRMDETRILGDQPFIRKPAKLRRRSSVAGKPKTPAAWAASPQRAARPYQGSARAGRVRCTPGPADDR